MPKSSTSILCQLTALLPDKHANRSLTTQTTTNELVNIAREHSSAVLKACDRQPPVLQKHLMAQDYSRKSKIPSPTVPSGTPRQKPRPFTRQQNAFVTANAI